MRNFVTLAAFAAGANALPSSNGCCFHLTASGGASGTIGQLDDGQNRIGGSLPPAQFCIGPGGTITDGHGRGCILTPPTTQFQCDEGGICTPGFSVNLKGQLEYNGSTDFVACETGQNGGLNIYTTESAGVTMCRPVQLNADACAGTGPSSTAPGVPSSPGPQSTSTAPIVSPSASTPGSEGPGQVPTTAPGGSPSPSSGVPTGGPGGPGGPGGGTGTIPEGCPTGVPGGPGGGTGTVPAICPSPGAPTESPGGPGTGTATVPVVSPSPSGPGEGTTTVPVVSPVPTCPGPESPVGPCESTGTVPVVTPSPSMPGTEGPGAPGGGTACPECETETVFTTTTVTLPCPPETPGVPIPGESITPGVPGSQSPGPHSPSTGTGVQPQPSESPSIPVQPPPSGTPQPQPSESPSPPQSSQPPQPPQPQPSGECCPTDLSGDYEFPHLIVPVDSSSPDDASGTSLNGTVSPTVSTIFNFDVPATDAGRTCSLVFLFPKQEELETSAFSFSGDGMVQFGSVTTPASTSTTYNNAPQISENFGEFTIAPGNSYSICTFECPAGQTVGYEMANAGSTNLEYFEDYNPSPIGLYITKC